VLAIDQAVEEKNGQRVVVGKTATFELSQRQAERLVLARQMGTLTMALRSLADADPSRKASTPEPDEGSGSRMNMVRFGISSTVTPK
jgi:pilus assembly protein CpaB